MIETSRLDASHYLERLVQMVRDQADSHDIQVRGMDSESDQFDWESDHQEGWTVPDRRTHH